MHVGALGIIPSTAWSLELCQEDLPSTKLEVAFNGPKHVPNNPRPTNGILKKKKSARKDRWSYNLSHHLCLKRKAK